MKYNSFILLELLQSFDNAELKGLEQILTCHYFNTDQQLVKLFRLLKKVLAKDKEFDAATQTKIYQQLKPTDAIAKLLTAKQKDYLRAKMSNLLLLAQRFLTIAAIDHNPIPALALNNQQLLEKKQYRLFERQYNKIKKQLEEQDIISIEHYGLTLQLERDKLIFLDQKEQLEKKDNFSELMFHLDLYYLLDKMNLNVAIQSFSSINGKIYDLEAMDAIVPLMNLSTYQNNELIRIYQTVIILLKHNREQDYLLLLELLGKHESLLTKKDTIEFYAAACNFGVMQIRKGNLAYNLRLLNLYKLIESKDVLMNKDLIQVTKLSNIVGLSCRVGEFEWATMLTNKYIPYVAKEMRDSTYHANMGIIEFYKKNYKQAIHHLIRVETIGLTLLLSARVLLLKAHYEIDTTYDELTMKEFRSAEKFVKDNKQLSSHVKNSYKNFIQVLINLYRVKHRVGKRTVASVEEKMNKMEFLSDKQWLREKMKAL